MCVRDAVQRTQGNWFLPRGGGVIESHLIKLKQILEKLEFIAKACYRMHPLGQGGSYPRLSALEILFPSVW